MVKKWAYYNEIDPNAAEWLRQLMKLGQIPSGEVDERSIVDVAADADSIKSFCQLHFFAGIGVWAYALKQAGWDDDRPVFSGSCPCQSFSAAGKQRGFADDRHLWPHLFRIICELRPETIFGEQVSSKLALQWWDLVANDLESADYATTAFDLEAAGCGAPHHRSRLFWMAHANSHGNNKDGRGSLEADTTPQKLSSRVPVGASNNDKLGNTSSQRFQKQWLRESDEPRHPGIELSGGSNKLADSNGNEPTRCVASGSSQGDRSLRGKCTAASNGSSPTFWDDAIWLPCRDGKYRATKPSISPLVDGTATGMGYSGNPSVENVENTQEARVMRLKGYGNAIVAPLCQAFIRSVMESID